MLPAYDLEVAHVIEETKDARSLILRIPDALRQTFRYFAGQFLTFTVQVGERTLNRCYSLSSAPGIDEELSVTVKRVPSGPVSNWLVDCARPGTRLKVHPPAGRFVLRESDAPVVFFAGGSGITPIFSMMKAELHRGRRRMVLLNANRNWSSVIFRNALDSLAHSFSTRLHVVHHLDDRQGIIEAKNIVAVLGDLSSPEAYICGPSPFMSLVENTLAARNFGSDRIFLERFTLPETSAGVESVSPSGIGGHVIIEISGQRYAIDLRLGETVLEGSKRSGVDVPSACEEGICGTCVARVVSGKATMRENHVLSDIDVARGLVLTCQALPSSPVLEIEY